MSKIKFKEIEIIALLRDCQKIINSLQKKSIVELQNVDDNRLSRLHIDKNITLLKERIKISEQAMKALMQRGARKGSLLDTFEGRKELTFNEYEEKSKKIKNLYGDCLYIVSKEKEINEKSKLLTKAKTDLNIVKEWEELDIKTSYRGTKHTSTFIGFIKKNMSKEDILSTFKYKNINVSLCDVRVLKRDKLQTKLVVTCHKELEELVYETLVEENFSYPVNPTEHPPIVRINRLKTEIANLKEIIEQDEKIIKGKISEIDNVEFTIDYFNISLQKYEGVKTLSTTKKTAFIKGYVIEKDAKTLKEDLEKKYSCYVEFYDIEEKDPPVLLDNGSFAGPVEPITEMYALPNKRDIDPTSVMAFFYYLFFGMMLSDAGYGLVMIIATHLIIKKKKPEGTMKKTLKMFFYCGISTLIWGAAFGGWFGDIVHVIGRDFFSVETPSLALWYEPMTDPMKLLLLSFLLGIFHLFLGYIVRFNILYKEGDLKDAILEVVPTMLLILGAAPLGTNILVPIPSIYTQIGSYIAIIAIVLIVLTTSNSKNILARIGGGIYGLYNIASGSLSDVLSYSRLLALGLATGSIANVVNLMGSMPSNIVFKGILLFFVFFIGHTLNLAINMLGSYVHANRLQFVELFSKFYEGGGRHFKPLKPDTRYIKLSGKKI